MFNQFNSRAIVVATVFTVLSIGGSSAYADDFDSGFTDQSASEPLILAQDSGDDPYSIQGQTRPGPDAIPASPAYIEAEIQGHDQKVQEYILEQQWNKNAGQ